MVQKACPTPQKTPKDKKQTKKPAFKNILQEINKMFKWNDKNYLSMGDQLVTFCIAASVSPKRKLADKGFQFPTK